MKHRPTDCDLSQVSGDASCPGVDGFQIEESVEHMQHADIDTILISTLQTDPDPQVRSAAAEGLAVVDLGKGSYHHMHDRLDDTLLKHGIP